MAGQRADIKRLTAWSVLRCLAVLLLLLLTSCLSLAPTQPPGFERANGALQPVFAADSPASVRYALMTWYLSVVDQRSVPAETMLAVGQLRDQAGEELYRVWAERLTASTAPLLILAEGAVLRVEPTVLSASASVEDGMRLLDTALLGMQTAIPCVLTDAEINDGSYWRKHADRWHQAFVAWARAGAWAVSDPAHLQRTEIVAGLTAARAQLEALGRVKAALASAAQLSGAAKGIDALDVLQKARSELPADSNFASIGDVATLSQLQALWEGLPDSYVAATLDGFDARLAQVKNRQAESVPGTDGTFLAVLGGNEKELSDFLRLYRQDTRFSAALGRAHERIRGLVGVVAELRSAVWCSTFQALASRREFWDSSEYFKQCRDALAQESGRDLELYFTTQASAEVPRPYSEVLRERLVAEYLRMLPNAYDEFLTAAERAANITNKYGQSLAMCVMLQQMTAQINGQEQWPATLLESKKRMEQLLAMSRQTIFDTYVSRTLSVSDLTSATPGVGMTYARDIETEMRGIFDASALSSQIRVTEPGMVASPWGYTVYGGVVANFDGKESAERQAMRTVRYAGEGKRQANPDYQPDAPAPLSPRQQSPSVYTQDVFEQVIRVREVERLSQVRVFFNLRGPGLTTLVEVNEFYTKKFMQEESHPFNDVRVSEVRRAYDVSELLPQGSEPTLRYDRVWTPGEMLDWARRDSLRMVALHLLYHINQYPLFLSETAARQSKAGDVAEALEQLSRCYVLCSSLDIESDLAVQLRQDQPPAALAYEACLAKLRQQREDINELKRTVLLRLINHTNELLRQRRQTAPAN